MRKKHTYMIIFLLASILSSCHEIRLQSPPPFPTETTTPQLPPTPVPLVELISLDQEWNQYINRKHGFSIKVPKIMYRWDAVCIPIEKDEGIVYKPGPGYVPVIIIDGNTRVYITSETVIFLSSSQIDPTGRIDYPNDQCEIKINTLEMLWNRDYSSYIWDIYIKEVESEEALEQMVDNYYGECFSVDEITPVDGKQYSLVHVVGDQKPAEESNCLLRGMYIFLYSRELKLAATWKTGQSIHFLSYPDTEGYDQEMYQSFEFIPKILEGN